MEICTCNFFPPSLREFRSVGFSRDLALYWAKECPTAPTVLDTVLDELYEHHVGKLYALNSGNTADYPLDVTQLDDEGEGLLDWSFGQDPERTINRFFDRLERPYKNRLSRQLFMPVLMLHYARQIRECRTKGRCSKTCSGTG